MAGKNNRSNKNSRSRRKSEKEIARDRRKARGKIVVTCVFDGVRRSFEVNKGATVADVYATFRAFEKLVPVGLPVLVGDENISSYVGLGYELRDGEVMHILRRRKV